MSGRFDVRWINVTTGDSGPRDELTGGDWQSLAPPASGRWAVAIARPEAGE